jgi:hypothetical protein
VEEGFPSCHVCCATNLGSDAETNQTYGTFPTLVALFLCGTRMGLKPLPSEGVFRKSSPKNAFSKLEVGVLGTSNILPGEWLCLVFWVPLVSGAENWLRRKKTVRGRRWRKVTVLQLSMQAVP